MLGLAIVVVSAATLPTLSPDAGSLTLRGLRPAESLGETWGRESPPVDSAPRRLRLTLAGGAADYHVRLPRETLILKPITESGSYTVNLPIPSPVIYPNAGGMFSVLGATGGGPSDPSTNVPLKARGWSNEAEAALDFAPDGLGRRGLHYRLAVATRNVTIKGHSTSQVQTGGLSVGPGNLFPVPDICNPLAPYLYCISWVGIAPFSYQYLAGSTAAGAVTAAQAVLGYNTSERMESIRPRLELRYEWPLDTWLGPIDLSFGAAIGVNWYTIKRSDQLVYVGGLTTAPSEPSRTYILSTERHANGPGVRADLHFGVSGPVPRLPLRWSLSASGGVERVDLTLQVPAANSSLSRARPVSSLGAGIAYELRDASLGLTVSQDQDFYLSITGGGPGRALTDGSSVEIRTALSTAYRLAFTKRF